MCAWWNAAVCVVELRHEQLDCYTAAQQVRRRQTVPVQRHLIKFAAPLHNHIHTLASPPHIHPIALNSPPHIEYSTRKQLSAPHQTQIVFLPENAMTATLSETERKAAIKAFEELGLCTQLAESAANLGWKTPSPIQLQAVPPLIAGATRWLATHILALSRGAASASRHAHRRRRNTALLLRTRRCRRSRRSANRRRPLRAPNPAARHAQ